MKRSTIWTLWISAAVFGVVLAWLESTGAVFAVLSFPLVPLGGLLRALSLTGLVGNAVSVALFAGFCLIPVFWLWYIRARRSFVAEDILLLLLSVVSIPMLYQAVNPGFLPANRLSSVYSLPSMNAVLWGLFLTYAVVRFLRRFRESEEAELFVFLGKLLIAIGWILAAGIGQAFGTTALGMAASQNPVWFSVFQTAMRAVPPLLGLSVTLAGVDLFRAMVTDRFSASSAKTAAVLSERSACAVAASVLTPAIVHFVQWLALPTLADVQSHIDVPFFPLLFAASIFLLSRMIESDRRLKRENDLFI